MRAALADDNALDRRATARTGFSLLVIDSNMMIVVASFSPQVAILAEGCSPVLDAKRQY